MRIGILTGEYPPMQGGIGAYTSILAGELTALGHDVSILTTPLAAARTQRGANVSTALKDWGLSSIPVLREWATSTKPDVINLQFQTAAFKMSPVVHFLPDVLRPTPFVTTFHDLRHPYLFPKAGRLRDWIVMRLARASSGAIVTNHDDAERLRRLPNVQLIPIGSNIRSDPPGDATSIRQAAGAAEDEALIVYFGLVNRSKGLDTLLKAVRHLLNQQVRLRLALIGAVAGDSDPTNAAHIMEIDRLIRDLQLEATIHRTPYLEEEAVAGYLAAADVVALPFADGASYRRGSLMAAIRLGCAIATTVPRVTIPAFQDGVNMCLVPPNDAAALAETLTRILIDGDLRSRLRANATALSHSFDWSRIAQDTAAFFEQTIDRTLRARV